MAFLFFFFKNQPKTYSFKNIYYSVEEQIVGMGTMCKIISVFDLMSSRELYVGKYGIRVQIRYPDKDTVLISIHKLQ